MRNPEQLATFEPQQDVIQFFWSCGVRHNPYSILRHAGEMPEDGDTFMLVLPAESEPEINTADHGKIGVTLFEGVVTWTSKDGVKNQIGERHAPISTDIQSALRSLAGVVVMFVDKQTSRTKSFASFVA